MSTASSDDVLVELSRRRTGMSFQALVGLGIGMLVLGIIYHVLFMTGFRKTREEMTAEGRIHGESKFPPFLTLITALVLLVIGIAVVFTMV